VTTLVLGSTGNVGREVVRALRARGLRVRAAGVDPERVRQLFGDDVERVRVDFHDPSTYAPALLGVRSVFLLRPPAISDVTRTLNPFVDQARAAGADHVVFLSVAGADTNRLVPHHKVERHLRSRSGRYTILRPGFFAQNLADAYRRDLLEDNRLFVPAGNGRVAFVDLRDVADVAALAFASPELHAGSGYTLTGPRAFSFAEAALLLSQALARPIRYEAASALGYVAHLRRRGLPLPQCLVQMVLHVGLRFGQAERVDPTLERLIARTPRSLSDYIRDNAELLG
jgi:uncharacterized protein YbjT (DUF2867 family)